MAEKWAGSNEGGRSPPATPLSEHRVAASNSDPRHFHPHTRYFCHQFFCLIKDRLSGVKITDRLPPWTRDDWCRASAVLVHLGFGPRLVELLVEQGADVRLMPWFAAVEAHVLGDQRYLQNIPAEARQVAGEIYTAIDRYRRRLQ